MGMQLDGASSLTRARNIKQRRPSSTFLGGLPSFFFLALSLSLSISLSLSRFASTGLSRCPSAFFLVLLGFTEFYQVLLSFTGFHQVLPSCTGFHRVLLFFFLI